MLTKILTGGEPGVEQAALRAAKASGVTVGDCEREPISTAAETQPGSAEQGESRELHTEPGVDLREQNILSSDATLWFGETTTKQAQTAVATCHRLGKPCMLIYPTAAFTPSHVTAWIREADFQSLNVTGNREADEPGIGDWVERFLLQVLQMVGQEQP